MSKNAYSICIVGSPKSRLSLGQFLIDQVFMKRPEEEQETLMNVSLDRRRMIPLSVWKVQDRLDTNEVDWFCKEQILLTVSLSHTILLHHPYNMSLQYFYFFLIDYYFAKTWDLSLIHLIHATLPIIYWIKLNAVTTQKSLPNQNHRLQWSHVRDGLIIIEESYVMLHAAHVTIPSGPKSMWTTNLQIIETNDLLW